MGIVLLAVLLFPLYWIVNVSLQHGASSAGTDWFPIQPDLGGYRTALGEQGDHLVTSLVIGVGSAVLSVLIAAPAAYALAQFRSRWVNVVLFAVLISQMVPGIVVANALYSAYQDLGLLDSYLGLILADSTAGIPFAILVIRAFMLGLPRSVIEAANLDGAGHVRTFVSVVLPMSVNAIVTAALFAFLFAWGDFLFALTLTTTGAVQPATLGLYQYIGSYVSDWSSVMATAVLSSIPAVLLLAVAQPYVAAGTTAGAVK
ncbi:carbohydrate ABC transporter permease [Nonomuraea bangladeshensis]|uniref:carbohydrate ABC transporter permease n=1 Tax=Nonomuraea bangladeshensis TaxID=404385 RepID=UPI003C2BFE34